MSEKQDFPMMIYHVTGGNKVVQNNHELNNWLTKGWSKSYKEVSELLTVERQIEYHKLELAKLEVKRESIMDEESIKIAKRTEVQEEQKEVKKEVIKKAGTYKKVVAKRGRPRKG